ncbi:hypothetical protein FNJ62_07305 [Streptomyces benahoarensis]|uniref:Uncharacterized protein n=1 Tax=Streptomyces benahoarensis TaxID=2595054 RepID=A0A553ZPY0_9ACTN|nr:hypothetical protein FNJ62_07305 [Streptomyces benahoarensis]TSB43517.1 hypothetical protein FNZ23_04085 [Streptomyces benahoarensis]
MTTLPAPPPRDRALGRGVSTLIPQSSPVSPADRATAALAAIETVPVHVGVRPYRRHPPRGRRTEIVTEPIGDNRRIGVPPGHCVTHFLVGLRPARCSVVHAGVPGVAARGVAEEAVAAGDADFPDPGIGGALMAAMTWQA